MCIYIYSLRCISVICDQSRESLQPLGNTYLNLVT